MKYLKRIFHAPSSTSNVIVLLETGTLPIEQEIHKRQLNFLHHILTLENTDPVKLTYQEQLKYPYEKNWGNEIKELRINYGIIDSDEEITHYSKDSWKTKVKTLLKQYALEKLNRELSEQKHGSKMSPYEKLQQQKYLDDLSPQQARKLFHVRAGIVDLKCVRKYWYSDTICRLCGQPDEDVEHVVNKCFMISRTTQVDSVFSNNLEVMTLIAERCILFANKVKDQEQERP